MKIQIEKKCICDLNLFDGDADGDAVVCVAHHSRTQTNPLWSSRYSILIKLSMRWHPHRFRSICIKIAIAFYWQNNANETSFLLLFSAVTHHARAHTHRDNDVWRCLYSLPTILHRCWPCMQRMQPIYHSAVTILVFGSICIEFASNYLGYCAIWHCQLVWQSYCM